MEDDYEKCTNMSESVRCYAVNADTILYSILLFLCSLVLVSLDRTLHHDHAIWRRGEQESKLQPLPL